MGKLPECTCGESKVVVNTAGGKDFFVCRSCKQEVYDSPTFTVPSGTKIMWDMAGHQFGSFSPDQCVDCGVTFGGLLSAGACPGPMAPSPKTPVVAQSSGAP